MKNKSHIFIALSLFILIATQCGRKQEEKESSSPGKIKNPNGMSEMALLMEEMSQTFFQLKDSIEKNGHIGFASDTSAFKTIITAHTTKKNVINDQYKAYANSFLISYQILLESTTENRVKEFNRAVTSCKNCHQDVCPGPIVRINKLFISEQ